MKFKAQDKQNQLIENITSTHLVSGVDIAQEIHVASAVKNRGGTCKPTPREKEQRKPR